MLAYTTEGTMRARRIFIPELLAISHIAGVKDCAEHSYEVEEWSVLQFGYLQAAKPDEVLAKLKPLVEACEVCKSQVSQRIDSLECDVTLPAALFEERTNKAARERLTSWYLQNQIGIKHAVRQAKWYIDCVFRERELREKIILQGLDLNTAEIRFLVCRDAASEQT